MSWGAGRSVVEGEVSMTGLNREEHKQGRHICLSRGSKQVRCRAFSSSASCEEQKVLNHRPLRSWQVKTSLRDAAFRVRAPAGMSTLSPHPPPPKDPTFSKGYARPLRFLAQPRSEKTAVMWYKVKRCAAHSGSSDQPIATTTFSTSPSVPYDHGLERSTGEELLQRAEANSYK